MKVVIEYERLPLGRRTPLTKQADLGRLTDDNGNLYCPRCTGMVFTASVNKAGQVVLSCFRCPTHIRV